MARKNCLESRNDSSIWTKMIDLKESSITDIDYVDSENDGIVFNHKIVYYGGVVGGCSCSVK